jgi:hypothetical protein
VAAGCGAAGIGAATATATGVDSSAAAVVEAWDTSRKVGAAHTRPLIVAMVQAAVVADRLDDHQTKRRRLGEHAGVAAGAGADAAVLRRNHSA